jgi:hypothetical protein
VNAEQWNALYPIGTPVLAYPGARPEDHGDVTRLVTRTRSAATVLGGHTDVVWVDGHSACIALSHVDPVTEEQFAEAHTEETAAAVAAQGALPVPVGDQPQPLDDARLAEREDSLDTIRATKDRPLHFEERDALRLRAERLYDREAALLAEVERLKAELASAREDAAFMERNTLPELRRTVEHHQAGKQRWRERAEKAEARVAELEAEQQPPDAGDDDPNDNRRRLYIDGKGNGWISVCSDEGTEWVVPVQPEAAVEQDVRDVADETGSLREIGRCW